LRYQFGLRGTNSDTGGLTS